MAFRSQNPQRTTDLAVPPASSTRGSAAYGGRHFRLVLVALVITWLVLAALLPNLRPILLAFAALYLVGGVIYIRTMPSRETAKVEASERGFPDGDDVPPARPGDRS
ncbi:MAG TPA: hypothetical protein VMF55_02955 [Solirubrobacterales bacterium]|nr:hypothetical protein [Solirubrobacterales bacterium]